ncbi:hypothetical protein EX30DRAFT_363097 [Ascodesmis nigricans]|uniref:Uncharacterized protein n=1 Tax=Ascodesmis nigricans TaxID=341454 RepID=A0A4V3SJ44_9PEZI|nr:hypothetical protein EX30DRAFT_363097 [Ascodesmis nigricans]
MAFVEYRYIVNRDGGKARFQPGHILSTTIPQLHLPSIPSLLTPSPPLPPKLHTPSHIPLIPTPITHLPQHRHHRPTTPALPAPILLVDAAFPRVTVPALSAVVAAPLAVPDYAGSERRREAEVVARVHAGVSAVAAEFDRED